MSPSESIRKQLNESGVEYHEYRRRAAGSMEPTSMFFIHDSEHVPYASIATGGHDVVLTLRCTPEQAVAATVNTEPEEVDTLKLHDRMNAALLDMNEVLVPDGHREDISTQKLIDCVIAAHQIVEDAATMGVGTCHNIAALNQEGVSGYFFVCSECGLAVHADSNIDKTNYPDRNPDGSIDLRTCNSGGKYKFERCPRCGRKVVK